MSRPLVLAVSSVVLIAVLAPPALASPIFYHTHLTGAAEVPANSSPGIGDAVVTYDPDTHLLRVQVSFSGLTSGTTASHIHSPPNAAGTLPPLVATTTPTFPGFPLGVTSGAYDRTFDLTQSSSWNPAFVTATGGTTATAESVLAANLALGTAYLNIHTSAFSGGEIRGFLAVGAPEPATWAVFGLMAACGGLAARRKVRRSSA